VKTSSLKWISLLFLANAIVNWTVSLPGIVDPAFAARMFGGVEPNYPSVIRLWQSFVFMFGCMFFEVSRDVIRKAVLVKYNWIEKTITASAITAGYFLGDIPPRLMLLIVFTNWLWIPLIVWADVTLHLARSRHR
jgi:hypothetical protein